MLSKTRTARFLAAIRHLLRPVVRQMIAFGVPYQSFDRIVRGLYVEVAERDFPLADKRQTDSRLSLITGLNRKEIANLRQQSGSAEALPTGDDSAITHVIGRWMAGPPYATPDGHARPLPYEPGTKRQPSFARLVQEAGADVPVRSVLDELMRIGAADISPDGVVELRPDSYIPAPDSDAKLAHLGTDPSELFQTIVHNIEHPDAPRLQRKVVYDNIGGEAREALQEEARRLGEEFIRRGNALLASYDRDRNPDAPGGAPLRISLGTYYFEEQVVGDAPPQPAPSRPRRVPGRIRRSK